MNFITAVSDCNARPCQKLSYVLRVELALETKVCETLSFHPENRIYVNAETGIAVIVYVVSENRGEF
jgi:hypothetical protein